MTDSQLFRRRSERAQQRSLRPESLSDVVRKHRGFVVHVVKRYLGTGADPGDLLQAGMYGLMKAWRRYDPSRGIPFIEYAAHWIRLEIDHEAALTTRPVRLPWNRLRQSRQLRRTVNAILVSEGRQPSNQKLADLTGIDSQAVGAIMAAAARPISLNTPVSEADGDDGEDLIDTLAGDGDPHRDAENAELNDLIDSRLSVREREVIRRAYGLGRNRIESIREIAADLEITQQRVGQIRAEAIGRLRQAMGIQVQCAGLGDGGPS